MDEIQEAIKNRYSHLHPLLIQRSIEKARSNTELFDILDQFDGLYPVIWGEDSYSWTKADLLQGQGK
jgi:hypothetical protein